MITGYDETTEHRELTEFDRLIAALAAPAPSEPEVLRALLFTQLLTPRQVTGGRESHLSRFYFWLSFSRRQTAERRAAAEETVRAAASQALERQQALMALAQAAVERLRDESARDLADLLEKSVSELEAERQKAAQAEGERESYDPQEILGILPESYREWFLADYRRALRTAYPPGGFLALQRMLRQWRARAEHYASPDHPASLEEARQAESRPWSEIREELRAQGRLR